MATALNNAVTAADGTAIATKLSREAGSTEIQQFGLLTDQLKATFTTEHRNGQSSADGVDLSSFGSTGTLDINDSSVIVVAVEADASDAEIDITPVYFDSTGALLFVGETKTFTATTLRRTASGAYLCGVQMWDTYGADNFRVHVTAIAGTSPSVDVFADVI